MNFGTSNQRIGANYPNQTINRCFYGIDASSASVEIASQRLPDACFVEGDIESMPYSDGQFDVVFAANVLQYAENRQIAAAELARVCSRTGKVSLAYLDRQIGLHTEQYSKR